MVTIMQERRVIIMPTEDEVCQCMNVLAEAYRILKSFQGNIDILYAAKDFEQITTDFSKELDILWNEQDNTADFLEKIGKAFDIVKSLDGAPRFIKAFTLCCWLDGRLTYLDIDNDGTNDKFSLFNLIPFDGTNKILEIDALNDNYEETKVQIIPKFSIYKRLRQDGNEKVNPYANRDAFSFLNGKTKNISFISWDREINVHNLIIPSEQLQDIEDDFIVAFCPLTDKSMLEKEIKQISINGISVNGIIVKRLACPERIEERLKLDWQAAAEAGADLIVFPEMLGTEALEETVKRGKYNKVVQELCYQVRSNGGRPPVLTVLPSFWMAGKNSATIVNFDGKILAKQHKYVPYINQSKHEIEALSELAEKHYYIIHVPDVHRIAVLICADFLSICEHSDTMLFAEAGSTLVLVPSYSRGESDFMRLLPSLKCYGTTVIWGNSCGETRTDRVIGGCSLAGTDAVFRFNNAIMCEGKCNGVNACVFLIKLPLRLKEKENSLLSSDTVTHMIK
jgi:predicted amidohydrolase